MPDEVESRTIPSPKVCELARRLIAYEASISLPPALLRVSEKLRPPLTTLLGIAGYRAVLARALALAKELEPGLSAVYIEPYGALAGFKSDQGEAASVVLIAQLLGLLGLFIGNGLTFNLVLDVWPALPVSETKLLENIRP